MGFWGFISLYEGVTGPSVSVRNGRDSAPHALFDHELHVWVGYYEVQFGIRIF